MNALLEDRVTVLEGKMERLEANPQPGQNKAFSDGFKEVRADIKELRADFKEFGAVQTGHTQTLEEVRGAQSEQGTTLAIHTGQLAKIESDLNEMNLEIGSLRYRMQQFKDETTGRLTRLDLDVAGIRGDVTGIKGELAEFKVEVKGALAEILDRLPPKEA